MVDTFDFSRRAMLGGALGLGAAGALAGPAAADTLPSDPTSTFKLTATGITVPGDGAMDVLTWSFGTTSSVTPLKGGGTGGGAGKSTPADFVFVKRMDAASPLLHKACVTGKVSTEMKLVGSRGGESPIEYLEVIFSPAYVVSYNVAPSDTDAYPIDVVHVRFARITQTFRPRKDDGTAGTPISFTFDYAKNKVT